MVSGSRRKQEEVINVNKDVGKDGLKDADHGLLEERRSSFESKGEDCPLEMMVRDGECCFQPVRGMDTKLPKTRFEVKLRKYMGAFKVLKHVCLLGRREF